MKSLKFLLLTAFCWDVGSAVAASCNANSETTLKNCLLSAKTNPAITNIFVTTNIICSTPNCSYIIDNQTTPLTISGATATAGLTRTTFRKIGQYDQKELLLIRKSKSISLTNLIINDGAITQSERSTVHYTSCPPSRTECGSPVGISESMNITFDKIEVRGGKPMGIEVGGVDGLTILNSTITDSWMFGIWFSNSSTNLDVRIEKNTFAANRSNAIIYSAKTKNLARNTISGNTFYGNHYNAAFDTCGPGGKPGACSGGQLAIERNTDKLNIDSNIIRDGSMIIPGVIANGIEFAGEGISNVKMSNNIIKNNTGYGIVKNDSDIKLANVEIVNNIISVSGVGSFRFPEAIYSGTNAASNLQIHNGGTVTTYNPWVIWAAVSGARPTTKANLYTNGVFWATGTGYSIPNSSDMSFSLPISLANTCNLNRDDCNFQVELFDESAASTVPGQTHAKSTRVNIALPAYAFGILNGGIVMSYNPWVVWLSTAGVVHGTTARLYANGNFWGTGIGHATPASNSMSFQLPSNAAPNGCNLNRTDCNFEIEIVHPNGGRSAKYKMSLPAVK
jgi:hypothetical protein